MLVRKMFLEDRDVVDWRMFECEGYVLQCLDLGLG
jgi:hypothetical protein